MVIRYIENLPEYQVNIRELHKNKKSRNKWNAKYKNKQFTGTCCYVEYMYDM